MAFTFGTWGDLAAQADSGGGTAPTAAEVAAAVLGATVEGDITLVRALRAMLAWSAADVTGPAGGGPGTYVYKDAAGAGKTRLTAVQDTAGRWTVTLGDLS